MTGNSWHVLAAWKTKTELIASLAPPGGSASRLSAVLDLVASAFS
jgi:hypothetical protein